MKSKSATENKKSKCKRATENNNPKGTRKNTTTKQYGNAKEQRKTRNQTAKATENKKPKGTGLMNQECQNIISLLAETIKHGNETGKTNRQVVVEQFDNASRQEEAERDRLRELVIDQYLKEYDKLHQSSKNLFTRISLEIRLAHSTQRMKNWLLRVAAVRQS